MCMHYIIVYEFDIFIWLGGKSMIFNDDIIGTQYEYDSQ